MAPPSRLTMRQTVEGMTLVFDPEAVPGLEAVIQFEVTGEEKGAYYLKIAEGDCTFHLGRFPKPALTIQTPAKVWLGIGRGEISGVEALAEGLYQVQGDVGLLMRFGELFRYREELSIASPADQRPGGPLPLSGMAWLNVAFLPWMLFWIAFGRVTPWVSVFVPLVLSLATVCYRAAFGQPTFMELGSLGFFVLAGVLSALGSGGFTAWGSIGSSLVLGGLWLSSLVLRPMPLCAEYSRWGFSRRLWRTTLFLHPNAVISIMWGWQFLAAAFLGLAAVLFPEHKAPFTLARYLLLVPAFVFTIVYQRGSAQRRIEDIDDSMARVRFYAVVGLLCCAAFLAAIVLKPPVGLGFSLGRSASRYAGNRVHMKIPPTLVTKGG